MGRGAEKTGLGPPGGRSAMVVPTAINNNAASKVSAPKASLNHRVKTSCFQVLRLRNPFRRQSGTS